MTQTLTNQAEETFEVVAFYVGDMLCAIDCSNVLEILNQEQITYVYHAPDYILGVVNIRGQIVTIMDLKNVLDIPPSEQERKKRIIVTKFRDESIGLMVDSVQDILNGEVSTLSNPPSHLGSLKGSLIKKILKTEENLIAILNTEKILDIKEG